MMKRKAAQLAPLSNKKLKTKKQGVTAKGEQRCCSVCHTEQALSQFPKRQLSSKCSHEEVCCVGCVEQWLYDAVDVYQMPYGLSCPICLALLSPAEFDAAATPAIKARRDRLIQRKQQQEDPAFRWCLSPTCSAGQKVAIGTRIRRWTCGTCNFANCIVCEHPWHKGESCNAFQARMTGEHPGEQKFNADNEITVLKDEKPVKSCPGCDRKIEKSDGCSHMECPFCKIEFCWDCFAIYERDEIDLDHEFIDHEDGCPAYKSFE